MGRTKRQKGLCDVAGCYEKATVKWTTGGGTELFVCEKHDEQAKEQMGEAYQLMNPTKVEK